MRHNVFFKPYVFSLNRALAKLCWMDDLILSYLSFPCYTKKTNLPKGLHGSVCVVGKRSMHFFFSSAWVDLWCTEFAYHRHSRTRAIILNSKKKNNIQKSKAIIVIFTECVTDSPPRSTHHLHGGAVGAARWREGRGGGYCNNVLCTENTNHTIERHHW